MSDSVESDHLQSMHLADNPQPMHLGEEFLVAPGHILNPCQCRVGHASIRVCARTCGGSSAYASYHGVGNARHDEERVPIITISALLQ